MDEFDIGNLLFGDHCCLLCERKVQDDEEHIHVPLNDYLRAEMPDAVLPGKIGDDATAVMCSKCIVKSETGYGAEAHEIEIEVPDTLPEEWSR